MTDWRKPLFDVTRGGRFRLFQQHTPQNSPDWRGAWFFIRTKIKKDIPGISWLPKLQHLAET
jgi:hypothetical protein